MIPLVLSPWQQSNSKTMRWSCWRPGTFQSWLLIDHNISKKYWSHSNIIREMHTKPILHFKLSVTLCNSNNVNSVWFKAADTETHADSQSVLLKASGRWKINLSPPLINLHQIEIWNKEHKVLKRCSGGAWWHCFCCWWWWRWCCVVAVVGAVVLLVCCSHWDAGALLVCQQLNHSWKQRKSHCDLWLICLRAKSRVNMSYTHTHTHLEAGLMESRARCSEK